LTRKSFEDNYPIKDDFQRFDQRDSAFGRAIRRMGRMVEFGSEESKAEIIGRCLPGFSLVDFAFHAAAGMYEFLPGEHVSLDTGFYSWSPLGSVKKPEGVPKWDARASPSPQGGYTTP
jgi:hypothetical protein